MKCEECGSQLEIISDGGRYSRFGYRHSRGYQCPKCKAVYSREGIGQLHRVKVDIDITGTLEKIKKIQSSEKVSQKC